MDLVVGEEPMEEGQRGPGFGSIRGGGWWVVGGGGWCDI